MEILSASVKHVILAPDEKKSNDCFNKFYMKYYHKISSLIEYYLNVFIIEFGEHLTIKHLGKSLYGLG